ncbi:DNA/RNA polymerases superfamily protein [Gossypium australe]|uniref:DNA/RNA polymerases superfamily protein n=1 Tax=Gossypium australe TaxID=47621 RepID=A0A5B6UZS1_9ROSI|nr:DNA/RNA polymerases superfamily protein [Gossypium australe]
MDFVSGLSLTLSRKYSIWVIVDRSVKSAHFIPVIFDYSLNKLAKLYVAKIVRLHGVSLSIISDRGPRFTSRFWGKFHKALGSKLNFSTTFHSQTDGQSGSLYWSELNERKLAGVDLVREVADNVRIIHDNLKAASDRQKSYADLKRKDIEFSISEKVFLKVSP